MVKEVMKAKTSRKLYIPYYVMVLILLGFISYIKYNDLAINDYAFWGAVIFSFFVIKFVEIHRLSDSYEIHHDVLVHSQGIFNKKIKSVDFFAISDLDVTQNILQRILNFGDVNVRLFSKDSTTYIKNITNPKKFARVLEENISKRRATVGKPDGSEKN